MSFCSDYELLKNFSRCPLTPQVILHCWKLRMRPLVSGRDNSARNKGPVDVKMTIPMSTLAVHIKAPMTNIMQPAIIVYLRPNLSTTNILTRHPKNDPPEMLAVIPPC